MTSLEPYFLDKQQARRSFSQAADHYDQAAALQREVGSRLLQRLELVKLQPRNILDLGCGTGELSHRLLKKYRKSRVTALDIAHPMLLHARKRGSWLRKPSVICADAERLPFADNQFDLLISNLMLQWVQNIDVAFQEFQRVLAPGGLLLFTTFGPDTLQELRASWAAVDDYTHVNAFTDMHILGDALLQSRFAEPVMDVDRMQVHYEDVTSLMHDLKHIGAHNINAGRCRGLMGKDKLTKMLREYETFRRDGMLPASYEVVHGHAWAPVQTKEKPAPKGEFRFPLSRLRRK